MTEIGLLEKVEVVRTIEKQIPFTLGTAPKEFYTESIIILKHGENDFSIFYNMADYSIRGTWEEIAEDYEITMKEKLEK